MRKKGSILGVLVIIALIALIFYVVSQYATGPGERAEVSDIKIPETIKEAPEVTQEIEETSEIIAENKIPINKEASSFEFEGFTVAKSHVGTFDDWSGFVIMENNKMVGAEGIIKASSVNTRIDRLNEHLASEDFFDAEKYPEIKFKATDFSGKDAIGQLTFRGITKEVKFPLTRAGDLIASEFYLDVTPFKFKYTGINPEVRIKFEFKLSS